MVHPEEISAAIFDPRVKVIDHDPVQWANLYDLLMPAGVEQEPIYILHHRGTVLKVWPGYRSWETSGQIIDPRDTARVLYERTQTTVCVIDLGSWRDWLEWLQRTFEPNADDVLTLLLKATQGLAREQKYGIVIQPDPFAGIYGVEPSTPGLLLQRLVGPSGSGSLMLGILESSSIYTSLCLEIKKGTIRTITTCPDEALSNTEQLRSRGLRMMEFASTRFSPPVLGIFCNRSTAQKLKAAGWKEQILKREIDNGSILCLPDAKRLLSVI